LIFQSFRGAETIKFLWLRVRSEDIKVNKQLCFDFRFDKKGPVPVISAVLVKQKGAVCSSCFKGFIKKKEA